MEQKSIDDYAINTSDDFYEVEKIIGKRTVNNIIQYKVKWKDYPLSESTWEPLENFGKCHECIQEYETRIQKGQEIEEIKLLSPKEKKKELRSDFTLKDKERGNDNQPNCTLADFDFISIETVIQKQDRVYAYVKCKCRKKEFVAKIDTKVFYAYHPELLIQYYESKLSFG